MRLYTLEEARAALQRAKPLIESMVESIAQLRRIEAAVAAARRGVTGDGQVDGDPWQEPGASPDLEQIREQLEQALQHLNLMGIEVKDPATGLIDFRSERDGRIVYLCYRLGEPDIAFWHTLDGGFAGRRPL